MADDDLDMLQELLELAEDNDHGAHASAALHQDNVRPEAQKVRPAGDTRAQEPVANRLSKGKTTAYSP